MTLGCASQGVPGCAKHGHINPHLSLECCFIPEWSNYLVLKALPTSGHWQRQDHEEWQQLSVWQVHWAGLHLKLQHHGRQHEDLPAGEVTRRLSGNGSLHATTVRFCSFLKLFSASETAEVGNTKAPTEEATRCCTEHKKKELVPRREVTFRWKGVLMAWLPDCRPQSAVFDVVFDT